MTDIDFHPTSSATRDLPPVVVPVLMRELGLAQQGRYPSVAVDRFYRRERFTSERERVEYLVTLYERLRRHWLPWTLRSPDAGAEGNEEFLCRK